MPNGRLVTTSLRLLCPDKLKGNPAVRAVGSRVPCVFWKRVLDKRGDERTSVVGRRVVKPELYQQCIFPSPIVRWQSKRSLSLSLSPRRPQINDLSRSYADEFYIAIN